MIIKRFIADQMTQKLMQKFSGNLVQIINESHLHNKGANTHFKVVITSDDFKGQTLVQRQRAVFSALNEFWPLGVHSISIVAQTREELNPRIPKSPFCIHK